MRNGYAFIVNVLKFFILAAKWHKNKKIHKHRFTSHIVIFCPRNFLRFVLFSVDVWLFIGESVLYNNAIHKTHSI